MRRVSIYLVLTFLCCSCTHRLKYPAEYQAKDNPHYKASVYFVGTNWQIKDAVNRGETPDHWTYHTPDFWGHPKDEVLVTFHLEWPYTGPTGSLPKGIEEKFGPSVADGVWPLGRFERFFTESSQ